MYLINVPANLKKPKLVLYSTSDYDQTGIYTISKGLDITDFMSLNILVGILKGPVAFDSFSLSISASISVVEVGKR